MKYREKYFRSTCARLLARARVLLLDGASKTFREFLRKARQEFFDYKKQPPLTPNPLPDRETPSSRAKLGETH